jgi:hypothetical protein
LRADWLKINEEVACRKTVYCNNINKLRGLGKCLYKARRKWESKISKQEGRMEDDGGGDTITTVDYLHAWLLSDSCNQM